MRILLLQDDLAVREKIAFTMESVYGATVDEASNVSDALQILKNKKDPQVDLIIYDYQAAGPGDFESFRGRTINIPCLLSVQVKPKDAPLPPGNVIGLLSRPQILDELTGAIDGLIKKGAVAGKKLAYCRIRTKLLLSVSPLKGDIYIKLSDQKFVKIFHQGDVFDREDLEKYTAKKGVEYLYIRDEQCSEFIQKYKTDLESRLSHTTNIEEIANATGAVQETIRDLNATIGFTKEVQELAKAHVSITMKAIGKSPRLSDVLSKLRNAEGKYIASHSTLCAYLACSIASHMKWMSDQTLHKLNLAAFMHDITLENDELAACSSIDEVMMNGNKFSEEEIEAYKNHPIDAAKMAKELTEVPADVDAIIIQHHERPDASGFPRKLNHTYLSPLSCIFIVAHDLTQFALRMKNKFSIVEFSKTYREQYKTSQFKKILVALEELNEAVKKSTG